MFKLKLVLFAIFLIIGCVFALVPQGEANEVSFAAENSLIDDEVAFTEHEARDVADEEVVSSPCSPPSKSSSSSSSSTSAAATKAPTAAPTTRATPAPTTKATSAPTKAPTAAPTTRATPAPSTKAPTKAPTPAPTTKATPAPSTKAPTKAPTTAPTTKPSSTGSSGSVGLCDVVPTTSEPMKILVPLYVYPGSAWDTVASGASKVGTVAIINPNSGPDSNGPDSTYISYMTKLNNAGVEMVGYVYTSYGARAIADVKAAIDIYASKYSNIKGIFFDEVSDSASDLAFYTQAYNYVISKGMVHSIINPGVQPDEGYLAISTNIVIFENTGSSASGTSYASWVKCASSSSQKSGYKYKFSGIAHTTASSSASSIINTFNNQGIGMVYVTDGAGGCCTYNTLTSYFASEASTVASLNA